jgi:hypothetical protein
VAQQNTLSLERLDHASEPPTYPYSAYWWRAIAGMLLCGRVQPKTDALPNLTDVNRLCKEANFNQYLFERAARFLVAADIVKVSKNRREYEPGEYAEAFWKRDLTALRQASRKAFLAGIQQQTGYTTWRPTIALQSTLDVFAALFAAAFTGLALPAAQVGHVLYAFSQLPAAALQQVSRQLRLQPEAWSYHGWDAWLDQKGQQAFVSTLYMCQWAYVAEDQQQDWFFISDIARVMLGLEPPPSLPPLATDFKVLPNLCVLAAADLPPAQLVPLFRYCKIQRIDRVCEFQLNKKQFTEMPSRTSGEHELHAVLQALAPLPATIERFLASQPLVSGSIGIRGCSALVQPENAEVLAAIQAHRRLKGYLEAGAPKGYLLIKAASNPHEFVRRCQELGFTVKGL